MTRRRFKEWEVVATLIEQGIVIPCFRCKQPLPLPTKPNVVQREHIHEITLGGPDTPANCRFSHYDCHSVITNGTRATSAGSSKHRIAKARQGEKDRLIQKPKPSLPMSMRCRRCGEDFEDGVCPNCGPPVQRPFQKRQAVRG